jgi:hypothetical protein
LLDTIATSDNTYTTGVAGAWAWRKSGAIEGTWANLCVTEEPIGLGGADSVDEGSLYALQVGTPTDPGWDTLQTYVIHWGDGQQDTFSAEKLASLGRQVTHTYMGSGVSFRQA